MNQSDVLDGATTVEVLRLSPGDAIVLKFPDYLSAARQGAIRDAMSGRFPGRTVLILDGGADIQVLRQS